MWFPTQHFPSPTSSWSSASSPPLPPANSRRESLPPLLALHSRLPLPHRRSPTPCGRDPRSPPRTRCTHSFLATLVESQVPGRHASNSGQKVLHRFPQLVPTQYYGHLLMMDYFAHVRLRRLTCPVPQPSRRGSFFSRLRATRSRATSSRALPTPPISARRLARCSINGWKRTPAPCSRAG